MSSATTCLALQRRVSVVPSLSPLEISSAFCEQLYSVLIIMLLHANNLCIG